MADELHLRAEDATDIPALSALVQDMLLRAADIGWDRRSRRLLLIGSRFRREGPDAARVRSVLRFDFVERVQSLLWPADAQAMLVLLAVTAADGAIDLCFGGGARLKLFVECIDATLDDVGPGWRTGWIPGHD
jgi:hypothetical protein